MRGREKNRMGRGQTNRQTDRQTDGHVDSLTNSAQRAELVKIVPGGRMTTKEWDVFCLCETSISLNIGKVPYHTA